MKILFVSAVSDLRGGAEQVLLDLLANPAIEPILALPTPGPLDRVAAQHNISVVYFNPGSIAKVHRPLKLISILGAIPDSIRCSSLLRRAARQYGCEIIHSNGLKVHVLALLATFFGRGLRHVVHLHDIPYTAVERSLWRVLSKGVDRIVMVSRPCWPSPHLPDNVRIIPNGVMTPSYPAVQPAKGSSVLRLGFVGRFHPYKGLLLLVDWLSAARDTGLALELRLRGKPDPAMPSYWDTVHQQLSEKNLLNLVRVDGWCTGNSVYADIDVLVVPSDHPDPLPRVVLEAGALGIPVIAFPSGGIPTMIVDGKTGFLVKNRSDFAEVVALLSRNPELRRAVGEAAQQHIATQFTLDGFYEKFNTLYAELEEERRATVISKRPPKAV